MSRIPRAFLVCLTLTGLALLSIGCPQQEAPILHSEEEPSTTSPNGGPGAEPPRVVMEINRFDVLDWAPAAVDVATEAKAAVAATAEVAAAGDRAEGDESEQGPRAATILFELLVRFEGPGEAPEGVDVDIVHSDPSAQEKGRFREWMVTHEMQQGEEREEYLEFEIPDFEEGDVFSVLLSSSIPAEAGN